jgi:hypothetical protein
MSAVVLAEGRSTWSVHGGHIVLLAVWLLIVAVVVVRGRLQNRRPVALLRSPWLWGSALASALAGGVHAAVIGEHFAESTLYGAFFLVLTILQFAWAAWLVLRPNRVWLVAGSVAAVAVALLWLATRTVGIPLGPAAGETEPVGALDTLASAAEVLVAAFGVLALRVGRPVEAARTPAHRASRAARRMDERVPV